jgi:hypothetical protein
LLEELKTFLSRLKSLKVPSKYYGSIGKLIMEKKIKVNEKPLLAHVDATINAIRVEGINATPCSVSFDAVQ